MNLFINLFFRSSLSTPLYQGIASLDKLLRGHSHKLHLHIKKAKEITAFKDEFKHNKENNGIKYLNYCS